MENEVRHRLLLLWHSEAHRLTTGLAAAEAREGQGGGLNAQWSAAIDGFAEAADLLDAEELARVARAAGRIDALDPRRVGAAKALRGAATKAARGALEGTGGDHRASVA